MAAYLDNGLLDVLGIQYRLENGFVVNRVRLLPLAFVMRVDEPVSSSVDEDKKAAYAKVHALTKKGKKVWLISVEDLEKSGIYDDTWVCTSEHNRNLICWREGTNEMLPVSVDMWNNKLEEK